MSFWSRVRTAVLSALCCIPSVTIAQSIGTIVINEIHYDPADATSREAFVELINASESAVDVSGWRFTQGIDYTFPQGTSIEPQAHLVVAEEPATLSSVYGVAALGPWVGRLSKRGEAITLRNAAGGVVDRVDYGVGFPWPTAPKGGGGSAELIHPALDNDLGGSWRAAGTAEAPAEPVIYVGASATGWRYRKGTSEPPTAWKTISFNEDASWLTGQTSIGYADGDDVTQITDMSGNYTSLYFRKDFTVPAGSLPAQLALRVYVDDGAIVSINGTEVGRVAVSNGAKAFDDLAENHEAAWEDLVISNAGSVLRQGANVVAVHAMNSSRGSSDFSFDLELRTPIAGQGSGVPSPGERNSVSSELAAPQARQVSHLPASPRAGEAVTISAKVTDPDGVGSVILHYQTVEPGNYVRKTDAAFDTGWEALVMEATVDDASIYEMTIPADVQVHRRLVRYRIEVEDTAGARVMLPYGDDAQPNFAYFVYDGVPAWRGAFRPGRTPVQTYSADLMDDLPIYHLLAVEDDVIASQYSRGADGRHMLGTLVYNGDVYDHIDFENRGEASTYVSGKNKWRFHFNRARSFQARDTWGRKYESTWNKMSVDACASPWAAVNRGMAGIDEAISYRLYGLAGVPSSRTHHFHFRIVDDAAEASSSDQFEGDLWGLYLAVEDPDGSFLDDRGLPDGNVYKIEGGSGDKKHQGPTQPTSSSDWNAFRSATSRQTEAWWRQNMDLSTYYSYRACDRISGNVDLRPGSNHYFYHHPDGQWVPLPWDLDMMYIAETHWPGVIDQEVCLDHANIALEFRNRSREMLDLMCSDAAPDGGQIGQLIDEYAQIVNPTGQALTWADLDAAMWNMHPQTRGNANTHSGQTNHKGQFFYTPFGDSRFGGSWTRRLDSADFEGFVNYLSEYTTDTFTGNNWSAGNGNPLGYGYEFLASEARDTRIPNKPTITYIGDDGFPVNGLRFRSSSFSDPQGASSFGAMEWRLAEIAAPGVGMHEPGTPRRYEVEASWESGEIESQTRELTIPTLATRVGRVYRARVRFQDTTKRWSHWSEPIQFTASAPDLAILGSQLQVSEIMYHPADASAEEVALGYRSRDFEYIELRNVSNEALDLTDVRFTKGIDFDFPAGFMVPAGEYVLVVAHEMAFRRRYGDDARIAGSFAPDSLSNGGETIKLSFGAGAAIHEITYDDVEPWPIDADGGGFSLVLVDEPTENLAEVSNWLVSEAIGGHPGGAGGGVIVTRYAINTEADGPGLVEVSPSAPDYAQGAMVTLTAIPNPKARFVGWNGDASGGENPLQLTVSQALSFSATFISQYSLTTAVDGEGSVQIDPVREVYDDGTTVTLTAQPADGYEFTGWSDQVGGEEASRQITLDADQAVTAIFERVYTLTLQPTINGSVSWSPVKASYRPEEVVVLTALPAEGYVFEAWAGDIGGTTSPLELSITADTVIGASFTPVLSAFETWQTKFFTEAELAAGKRTAPEQDADGDGVANLIEYAQGTDPTLAAEAAVISLVIDDADRVTLSSQWAVQDDDLKAILESSSGLEEWLPVETGLAVEDGNLSASVLSSLLQGFLRLRVTLTR